MTRRARPGGRATPRATALPLPPPTPTRPASRAGRLLPPLLVAALAAAVFAPSLGNGFTLDDLPLVPENPGLGLDHLGALLTSEYLSHYSPTGLYRPLTMLSLALGQALHGPGPWGFHLVNVLLHAANAALVLLLFRRLGVGRLTGLAAAALFATHAVHTEAVAPISGRSELLCALFVLLALLAYPRGPAWRGARPALRYTASLACFALALLSKETAITLPGVVFLLDFVYAPGEDAGPLRRAGRVLRQRGLGHYAGFAAVAGVYLAARYLWLDIGDPRVTTPVLDNPLLELGFVWSRLSALEIAFRYLGLLLVPLHLSYDYSLAQIPLIHGAADPRLLPVVVGSALALWLVARSLRVSPPLFFALGFALITFSVASNLVVQMGTIMAERLLYTPSIGFCLALALAIRLGFERLPAAPRTRLAGYASVFALLAALHTARAVDRTADWASDSVLMLHDLAVAPDSGKVQANAGVVLLDQGRLEASARHLQRAIEIYPDEDWSVFLGTVLLELGRIEEAMQAYEKAVAGGTARAEAWNNLGYLLLERGEDPKRGVRLIETAVRLDPDRPSYLDSLGWAYYRSGDPARLEKARELVARAVKEEPNETRRAHLAAIDAALARRDGPDAAGP